MPIFHFNLNNSHHDVDDEGTELASLDHARVQAVIFAGEYLRDNPGIVWDGQHFSVEVTGDDSDAILFKVSIEASES